MELLGIKLCGKKNSDEDYCIEGISKNKFEELFPQAIIRGKIFSVYDIDGKEFALARKEKKVSGGHKGFQIETNENISIEEDLARRDITINSIAQDVLTQEYIDPFNGKEDIENKIIRMTSYAFEEDPLRVYRVARFAATLRFNVEDGTIAHMKLLKQELKTLSKERVFSEFKKALESDKPSEFFEVLRKAEVLDIHFKQIYDLIGKIQPEEYHPEGDSYNHTMMVVDASCKLTKSLPIRFSCLVHDLGKGTTPLQMLPHHYGHEDRGEELVENFANAISVPKLWKKCGKIAAKEHMRGGKFNEMTPKKKVKFIEKVANSPLGLDGMKVVVCSDRYRQGKFPENVYFDKLGKECLDTINGRYIIKKYGIQDGLKIKQKMTEERISWIRNNT